MSARLYGITAILTKQHYWGEFYIKEKGWVPIELTLLTSQKRGNTWREERSISRIWMPTVYLSLSDEIFGFPALKVTL